MARRTVWLLGAALLAGLMMASTRAAPPSTVGALYEAHLLCGNLITGDLGSQCMSDPLSRGAGWVQAYIDGDQLVLHGAYSGLSGPIVPDLALGVHLHHDPADYHVDTLIRGLPNEGGTSGLFHGSVTLTPVYRTMLETGRMYVDIHTYATGDSELKGVLLPVSYRGQASW